MGETAEPDGWLRHRPRRFCSRSGTVVLPRNQLSDEKVTVCEGADPKSGKKTLAEPRKASGAG
jgi:hypothetical protein